MATDTFTKFHDFAEQLGKGIHQLHAAGHTLKVYLTNNTPSASGDAIKTDLAEITAQNGYPSGGTDIQNDYTETSGTGTLTGVDVTFTASGGSFGPFRYAVIYNDSAANDNLICWADYGVALTVYDTETFKVDFGASILAIA
jgi:hypothetical protein